MEIKWNKHIVILYENAKDKVIVEALKQYIEREFEPCDVIDIQRESYLPIVHSKWRDWSYRFRLKYARWLLRAQSRREERVAKKLIKETHKTEKPAKGHSIIVKNNPAINRIKNIINRFEAATIICISPESLKLCLDARSILEKDFAIFGHSVDFAMDINFVRQDADGYFVENEECKNTLIRFGIREENIAVSGVPVLDESERESKEEIRKKYGFSDSYPIVVVNGGDYETDTIKEEIIALMRSREKYNMLVITGKDKVRRKYMSMPEFSAGVVFSERFEQNLLEIADILITVPDSNMIYSAFLSGVAVIVTPYITTLERKIRNYLVKRALVMPVKNWRETVAAVEELLVEPQRRQEFVKRGENYVEKSLINKNNKKIMLSAGIDKNQQKG